MGVPLFEVDAVPPAPFLLFSIPRWLYAGGALACGKPEAGGHGALFSSGYGRPPKCIGIPGTIV